MKVPLRTIAFELTGACNLDCVYCYNIWKTPDANIRPGESSYRKSIKTLKELFRQAAVQNVTLTGGEPFLASRLLEVAMFCRVAGKSVTVITNGTQGTEKDYRELLRIGISLFELPVHSADGKIHDGMTGVEGSWSKSVNSIKHLREQGADPVAVTVLTRFNIAAIDATLDFIANLGIERVMINRYNIGGRYATAPAQVSATHRQLCEAFEIIDRKAAEKGLKATSNVCTPHCIINPSKFPHIGFGNCSPNVLQRPITMDMDGNIRLCNHSPVVAGNIFQKPLEAILHSAYAKSWEEKIPAYCNSCSMWKSCMGGCRAASEQCRLGLDHPDPLITAGELADLNPTI